ncbi:hypothetical protein [Lysobacter sp. HA35]
MAEYAGARVPASLYWLWMLLMALLNLRVNTLAVSPAMRAPTTTDDDARYIRARGIATIAASLCALLLAQVAPFFGPMAMITLPFWRRLLYRRRPAPVSADAAA